MTQICTNNQNICNTQMHIIRYLVHIHHQSRGIRKNNYFFPFEFLLENVQLKTIVISITYCWRRRLGGLFRRGNVGHRDNDGPGWVGLVVLHGGPRGPPASCPMTPKSHQTRHHSTGQNSTGETHSCNPQVHRIVRRCHRSSCRRRRALYSHRLKLKNLV